MRAVHLFSLGDSPACPDLSLVIRRAYAPGQGGKSYTVLETNLHYVLDGQAEFVVDGHTIKGGPGLVVFSVPGDRLQRLAHTPHVVLHIHFGFSGGTLSTLRRGLGSWADWVASQALVHEGGAIFFPDHLHMRQHGKAAGLLEALEEERNSQRLGWEVWAASGFLQFLRLVSDETVEHLRSREAEGGRTGAQRHVAELMALAEQNLSSGMSIADYAQTMGLNPDYLGRVFRRSVGVTFGSYLRDRRLLMAKSLLLQGGMSMKDIAGRIGFHDPLYFSRVFRKRIGVAPSEYAERSSYLKQDTGT